MHQSTSMYVTANGTYIEASKHDASSSLATRPVDEVILATVIDSCQRSLLDHPATIWRSIRLPPYVRLLELQDQLEINTELIRDSVWPSLSQ